MISMAHPGTVSPKKQDLAKMKILQLSYSDMGGAAIAALRLHQGLLNIGVSSKFLSIKNTSPHLSEKYTIKKPPPSFIKRALNRLNIPQTHQQKHDFQIRKRTGKYEVFSSPLTDIPLQNHDLIQKADIIHLHWVANLIDWPSFFSTIKKPIVWTLHDMNPIQGGFHYYNDVQQNQASFGDLEERYRAIKRRAIAHAEKLSIVAPSKWLTTASQHSETLGSFPHTTIPYGLDTAVFKPLDQQFCRDVLNLPQDKKVILFVAQSIHNRRKGLSLLIEALKGSIAENVVLAVIGDNTAAIQNELSEQVCEIGQIKNERFMAVAYNAADLFVIPSLEDNLPNTVLESLNCGTPVVGFNIGGIPDMVIHEKNGLICPEIDAQQLALTIERALGFGFDQNWIRKNAVARFDQFVQAKRYIELYENIL